MMTLTLDMRSADLALSEAEFYRLCQANRDMRLELTAEGHLILMPPTGWETGSRNFDLSYQFGVWVKRDGTGIGFDSSTGFRLPNGAIRSPDVAWLTLHRTKSPRILLSASSLTLAAFRLLAQRWISPEALTLYRADSRMPYGI